MANIKKWPSEQNVSAIFSQKCSQYLGLLWSIICFSGDTWFDIMADKVKAAGDEFMKLEYHFDAGANAMRLKIGSFEKEQTKVLGQESIFSPADRPAPHLVKVRFLNNSARRTPKAVYA